MQSKDIDAGQALYDAAVEVMRSMRYAAEVLEVPENSSFYDAMAAMEQAMQNWEGK